MAWLALFYIHKLKYLAKNGKIFTLVDAPLNKRKEKKKGEREGKKKGKKEGKRLHQYANGSSCYIRIRVYM